MFFPKTILVIFLFSWLLVQIVIDAVEFLYPFEGLLQLFSGARVQVVDVASFMIYRIWILTSTWTWQSTWGRVSHLFSSVVSHLVGRGLVMFSLVLRVSWYWRADEGLLGVSRGIREVSVMAFVIIADGIIFALRTVWVVVYQSRIDWLKLRIRLDIEALLS